jgi:hypothetical protein
MKLTYKILMGIILLILIFFMYFGLQEIGPRPDQSDSSLIVFKTDFENNLKKMAVEQGSYRYLSFKINSNYNEVCFLKEKTVSLKKDGLEKESFSENLMIIDNDFCIKPIDRKIELMFSGLGNLTKVSLPLNIFLVDE